jgi:thioredoxin 1
MSVIDVNAADWEKEVLQSEILVLVDFWHERCTWCKRLAPIYEEVAKEYEGKVKFTKLNVLSTPENRQIGLDSGVMGTPTIVVFCEGRSVGTAVGFQPKERLQELVQDMIEKNKECIQQSTELKT